MNCQISTICHGDLWAGNVLFRADSLGNALKAKLTNFHAMAKGHPADDVAFFLYASASKTFRDIYMDLCLRTYFGVLKTYVDCKLEMTFEEFKKEFDERRELSVIAAMLVIC